MPITCVSTITPVDIATKRVKVHAVITNEAEPPITVTMEKVDISTAEKKQLAAGILWDKFLIKRNAYLAEQAIAQEIADLQTSLNTNIQGRTL